MKYKVRDLAALLISLTDGAARKELPEMIDKFLAYLKSINGARMLPAIMAAFDKEWNKKYAVAQVEVSSAKPLPENFGKDIKKILGKETEILETVDPALLGGIKLKIDDLLIDASLKARIENLKHTITN
ncbi:F0F1 ATP synthase subunit delta [Candidatus Uhrbacteria bacterium]|nr:F0F1 ATP synthase subunit delta [Candidatus Uhrbacteria bacterium]